MKFFVIAMSKEAKPVLDEMKNKRRGKYAIYGDLFGERVGVIVCGVGKVNAACGAQKALCAGAEVIINLGVAGGLHSGLEIGNIYAVSSAVQYDFDLTALNGGEIGTLDEHDNNYLPLDISLKYPQKMVGTGDRFNDSPEDNGLLVNTLKADIRDMECAAIVQACENTGVRVYSYKIISDIYGSGSTTEQYVNNLSVCFGTEKRELENILKGSV